MSNFVNFNYDALMAAVVDIKNRAQNIQQVQILQNELLSKQSDALFQILKAQGSQTTALADLKAEVEKIVQWSSSDVTPTMAKFAVPEHFDLSTGKALKMAFSVLNGVGTKIRIDFTNVAGADVPEPQGGTITVSLVDSAGAVSALGSVAMDTMANGDPAVAVKPAQSGATVGDATIMFEDVANADLKASLDITFTADASAANVHFDTTQTETFPLT